MNRIQKKQILRDLEKKMVLLVGPRQAGKTWLAQDIAQSFKHSVYLNYDQITDREIIHAQSWLPSTDLLIFDELHKMDEWKNYIKGVYDTKPPSMRILITGSARLDIYNQLGDSLAGRYFRHYLMPFSPAELTQLNQVPDMHRLLTHSGFPEPYLAADDREVDRWRLQYINSMLSTDVFQIDQIYNIKALQLIFNLLRNRVGLPVSYQSLAQDAAISPTTVKRYIEILEALFVVFRVTPYSKNIARSLLKEPKLYFFDTGLVQGDAGVKLENLVAVGLLKHAYAKTDSLGQQYNLYYLRTKEGIEVDFALVNVTNQEVVEQIIEVKLSDPAPGKGLVYFHEKYNYPAVQLVYTLRNEHVQKSIQVLSVEKFLSQLFL